MLLMPAAVAEAQTPPPKLPYSRKGLGALGATGTADAVNVNPDGLGQALLYPFYTTRFDDEQGCRWQLGGRFIPGTLQELLLEKSDASQFAVAAKMGRS